MTSVVLPRTIGELVDRRAERTPALAPVDVDGSQLTAADLASRSRRLAGGLRSIGVGHRDRVGVMLPNCVEFVETWAALARLGAIEVPVNPEHKAETLTHILGHTACRAIVIHTRLLDRLSTVLPHLPALHDVVLVGEAESGLPGFTGTVHAFAALLESASPDFEPVITLGPNDTSAIVFTSGTTGPSKGAILTHGFNIFMGDHISRIMDYTASDVIYCPFPLIHVTARYTAMLPALLHGGRAVMPSRFSVSRFWADCRAAGATSFNYMSVVLAMLLKAEESPLDREHSLVKAYGAPAPPEFKPVFEERFGVPLVEVYGGTEVGVVLENRVADQRLGSCGRPAEHVEVELHDPDGNPVPDGEVGEIVVRPRRPNVMFNAYYGAPEATVRATRGLWFHTGDRARTDADGYFYFVDRLSDSIRRRGENISSFEVERAAMRHPAVAECAAVGVRSELGEEEVLLVVRPRDADRAPEAIVDFCAENLPRYAVPRYVRFVDAFAKIPSERIEKYRLREAGLTPDTWDREARQSEPAAPRTR